MIALTSLIAAATRRRLGDGQRGSITMALLVTVIGAGIAALLLPIVITQTRTTTFDQSRVRQLNAAEAGVDVALGLLRAAVGTAGAGMVSALPCTDATPITGTLGTPTNTLSYSVKIGYYTDNPLEKPASWLAPYDATGAGHGMRCSPGTGTFYPPTGDRVPSFAQIVSTGSDGHKTRTIRAIYVIKTTFVNVAGGTILLFPSSTASFCMDAGSGTPAAGTSVLLRPCITPLAAQQAWAYGADLAIRLVSSEGSTYPNGLCLSSPPGGSGQKAGDAITLQPCAAEGSAPWNQKWSVDDVNHLQGSKQNLGDVDGLCINAQSQASGQALTLQACAGSTQDPNQAWVPSPDVGAGMAGPANDQIVNYLQFGRCLDITNQDITWPFLIAYPCKQNPDPSKVAWNQKLRFDPATGHWVAFLGPHWNASSGTILPAPAPAAAGVPFCLASPGAIYKATTPGPYVKMVPCAAGAPEQTWTSYGASDDSGLPLPPESTYTIQDRNGNCLSLTPGTDLYTTQWSKVIVEPCNGTRIQKWNAHSGIQPSTVRNFEEIKPAGP